MPLDTLARMDRYRSTALPTVITLVGLGLLLTAMYGAAYVLMCSHDEIDVAGHWRVYKWRWQATVFIPAAKVESLLVQRPVYIIGPDRFGVDFDFEVQNDLISKPKWAK